MRSLFANIRNLVLPSSAGVGQARLFIGPDLPPPLNSYVTANGPYAAAFVFYSQGDDTTYSYIGLVEDSVTTTTIVEWGHVVAGAVVELSANVPMALQRLANLSGVTESNSATSFFFDATSQWRADAGIAATLAALQVVLDAADTVITGDLHWRTGTGGADAVQEDDFQSAAGTTTSTTYTSTLSGVGVAVCGTTFVAPPSGKVRIYVTAGQQNSTAGGTCWATPEVREGAVIGSGTQVLLPIDGNAVAKDNTGSDRKTAVTPLSGLTAGDTYNVAMLHRTTAANTATFANRSLIVVPAL